MCSAPDDFSNVVTVSLRDTGVGHPDPSASCSVSQQPDPRLCCNLKTRSLVPRRVIVIPRPPLSCVGMFPLSRSSGTHGDSAILRECQTQCQHWRQEGTSLTQRRAQARGGGKDTSKTGNRRQRDTPWVWQPDLHGVPGKRENDLLFHSARKVFKREMSCIPDTA